MSSPAATNPTNSLINSADQYLRKHRIVQLFQDLCSQLCYQQPQNINQFLVQRLKVRQKQGFRVGFFTPQQISNVFTLFDLKRQGFIDRQRCKQALKTLANNQFQWEQVQGAIVQDKVDQKGFVALYQKILGSGGK